MSSAGPQPSQPPSPSLHTAHLWALALGLAHPAANPSWHPTGPCTEELNWVRVPSLPWRGCTQHGHHME